MNWNKTSDITTFLHNQDGDEFDNGNSVHDVRVHRQQKALCIPVRNQEDEFTYSGCEEEIESENYSRKSSVNSTETGLTLKHAHYSLQLEKEKTFPHRRGSETDSIKFHQDNLKERSEVIQNKNKICEIKETTIQEVNDYLATNVEHAEIKSNEPEADESVKRKKGPLPRPRKKSSENNFKSQYETYNETTEDQVCVANSEIIDESGTFNHSNIEDDVVIKTNSQGGKETVVSPQKRQKERRHVKHEEIEENEANIEVHQDNVETETVGSESGKIICIIIHRSDCLQTDMLVQHPLVKVHLLNASTGKYLKKSCSNRPVSFYYENKDIDYILPLMTKSFDFKLKRSLIPAWEEILIFNEDIQYILKEDVLIMFELLDFVNFSTASSQYKKLGPDGGWHKIAWAFLKPLGANQHYNVEKKLRLQLYNPVFSNRIRGEQCDVYSWWTQQIWERYPATLYVTVKGVTPPENILPALRSQLVLQQEKTSDALEFDNNGEGKYNSEHSIRTYEPKVHGVQIQSSPVWSRLPAQLCKIPNDTKLCICTLSKGCFLAKFSNSGLLLACTMANDDMFPINLYTIPDGKEYATFLGHRGLIYDLCWSSSDSMLLSGSADCTVCIWDIEKKRINCLQMLPHPSFVYSAKFHGHRSWLLATGCNDHVVRLWVRQHKANHYDLVQELEGHEGFISSLCFIQQHSLLSTDSVGSIFVWSCDKHSFSRKNVTPWQKTREFCVRELKGIVINKIVVHPGGQRLLIHSRDSLLRMLDITTGIVIQWFQGAINQRVQTSCCISPCGSLVFAASEDGSVYVWNADTGELTALYSGLNFQDTITCVDYHPFEHMVVFTSHGSSSRVLVCVYNKLSKGIDLGLQLMNRELYKADREKSLLKKHEVLTCTEKGIIRSDLQLSGKNGVSLSKDCMIADAIVEENVNTEESTSELWNGTSNGSSLKLDSLSNNTDSKRKIDLKYLISKMDEILSPKARRAVAKSSEDDV